MEHYEFLVFERRGIISQNIYSIFVLLIIKLLYDMYIFIYSSRNQVSEDKQHSECTSPGCDTWQGGLPLQRDGQPTV